MAQMTTNQGRMRMVKYRNVMVGAVVGAVSGLFAGLIVVPVSTQGWLFNASTSNIMRFSAPTLFVFCVWAGAVLADLGFGAPTAAGEPRDVKLVRHSRWSVILSAFALLLSLLFVLETNVFSGNRSPVYLWLLLPNGLGASLFSTVLGTSGIRLKGVKTRRLAAVGLTLGVLLACVIIAFLLSGGAFAIAWSTGFPSRGGLGGFLIAFIAVPLLLGLLILTAALLLVQPYLSKGQSR